MESLEWTSSDNKTLERNEYMSQLQVFKFKGNAVRTIERNGEPWFVLKDVCDVLGLKSHHVRERLTDDIVSTDTVPDSLGRPNKATVINEDGLYDVILESRKPEAKSFRKWITSDVLPTIRKHGAYLTPSKIEEVLADPDTIITLATQLKNARKTIEEQKPLVTFAELCMQSDSSVKVRELAHTLSSHGLSIGQNKLFERLREWNLICKSSTEPTQRAIEQGLFEVVTGVKQKPSGDPFTWRTPYATVKGQMYVADRLKKEQGA